MKHSIFNVCISFLLVASLTAEDLSADTQGPEPAATVKDVMQGLTVPNSDFLWGVDEAPGDNAGWDAIRLNAVMLEESAKLLMTEGRAREGEAWIKQALALASAAQQARAAADSQNIDGLFAASDAMYNACESCHIVYLSPLSE